MSAFLRDYRRPGFPTHFFTQSSEALLTEFLSFTLLFLLRFQPIGASAVHKYEFQIHTTIFSFNHLKIGRLGLGAAFSCFLNSLTALIRSILSSIFFLFLKRAILALHSGKSPGKISDRSFTCAGIPMLCNNSQSSMRTLSCGFGSRIFEYFSNKFRGGEVSIGIELLSSKRKSLSKQHCEILSTTNSTKILIVVKKILTHYILTGSVGNEGNFTKKI